MLCRAAILLCFLACVSSYIIGRVTHFEFIIKKGQSSQSSCAETSPDSGEHRKQEDSPRTIITDDQDQNLPFEFNGYRHLVNHNYYALIKEPGTDWPTARDRCKSAGGDLAVIDTEEEADFLLGLFSMDPSRVDQYVYEGFVGATDEETEGTFVTVHGELLSSKGFDTWLPNEPNNGDGLRSQEENCVTFHKGRGYNDVDCGRDMPYFCEITAETVRKQMTNELSV